MEKKLFSWYTSLKNNNYPVTPKMVKQKALQITKFSDFIASKGWLEKFKRKFKLELSRENKIETHKNSLPLSISTTTLTSPIKPVPIVNKVNFINPLSENTENKPPTSENAFVLSTSNCTTNSNTPAIK